MKINSLYIFKDIFKEKKPFIAFADFHKKMNDFFADGESFVHGFVVHPSYINGILATKTEDLISNVMQYKTSDLKGLLSLAALTEPFYTSKLPSDDLQKIFVQYSELFSEEFLLHNKEWKFYSLLWTKLYQNNCNIDNLSLFIQITLEKYPKEFKKQLLKDKQYELLMYIDKSYQHILNLSVEEQLTYLEKIMENATNKSKSAYITFNNGPYSYTQYERLLGFLLEGSLVDNLLNGHCKKDFLALCEKHTLLIRRLRNNDPLLKTVVEWMDFVASNGNLKCAVKHPYYLDMMSEYFEKITEKEYFNIILNSIEDISFSKKTGIVSITDFMNRHPLFKKIIEMHKPYQNILLSRALCHEDLRYRILWFLAHSDWDFKESFSTRNTSDFLKNHLNDFCPNIQYKEVSNMRNSLNCLGESLKWTDVEPHILRLLNESNRIQEATLYLD